MLVIRAIHFCFLKISLALILSTVKTRVANFCCDWSDSILLIQLLIKANFLRHKGQGILFSLGQTPSFSNKVDDFESIETTFEAFNVGSSNWLAAAQDSKFYFMPPLYSKNPFLSEKKLTSLSEEESTALENFVKR